MHAKLWDACMDYELCTEVLINKLLANRLPDIYADLLKQYRIAGFFRGRNISQTAGMCAQTEILVENCSRFHGSAAKKATPT